MVSQSYIVLLIENLMRRGADPSRAVFTR
jgi:hypothetical protein